MSYSGAFRENRIIAALSPFIVVEAGHKSGSLLPHVRIGLGRDVGGATALSFPESCGNELMRDGASDSSVAERSLRGRSLRRESAPS